ncbi:hypothetical protein vB_AbaP_Acibel007_7 [Acinetobacter phage vB_AbaP_Acibel007]|uniref:Uncharacterized protein n=1 Tax=Acinetobacter phage vB_AbaP_Acibel007 TaxID=1481187 RepID=A0A075DXV9_9CAUD|nr:hypothetical protein vB_AbaP_Acibel007_7 [Acinetobacter phage vB_AbaP_Acibel007]AHY26778.1 hypothetical protein vB_AbaP_Acibel007_7 [Acinetobacter phage vB_AbaP_Acibel007]
MREAITRLTKITLYTAAYYSIGAVAWLCDHEASKEEHHL